ncbi:Zinc transporter [Coniothyrium glycines]
MVLNNDARGWIMTVVSGIACTFGASIICVDLIIRQLPGRKNFKIEDSNVFLSTGLSLSFGVMIFSSLYSMLPSAKKYLIQSGMSPRKASFTLIGCFLLGAVGISILSRILHEFIPHSIVGCDHEHGDEEEGKTGGEEGSESHQPVQDQRSLLPTNEHADGDGHISYGTNSEHTHVHRPALHNTISSKVSQLVTGTKKMCDDDGQCYGYSDTCGTECFRNVLQSRPPRLQARKSIGNLVTARPSGMHRVKTTQVTPAQDPRPLLTDVDETSHLLARRSGPALIEDSTANIPSPNGYFSPNLTTAITHAAHNNMEPMHKHSRTSSTPSTSSHSSQDADPSGPPAHHHHVPSNAFLSIGLQTSCAIALHKIPEGFITYATNHANPTLGLSIFLALFIHNITEGFALALPLYLAINSRWKAMLWSTLLGGISQPLGAGVAALWFGIARRGHGGHDRAGKGEPGELVYGCMFAATAGIMAMVSLQLLGESLDLTHSRRLCFIGAFAGMGILGLSSALTA